MELLTKKTFMIGGVAISLLIAYVYISVIFLPGNNPSAEMSADAYAAEVIPAGEQSRVPLPEVPVFNRRLDVYEFIIGTLLSGLGLVCLVLAFLRWKTRDLLLISFGGFCFLYGARTNAFQILFEGSQRFWEYERWIITYLVPIPGFVFVEQILGRGWKSSIRRMWQIAAAFAVVAILAGIYWQEPGAAYVANNILGAAGILVVVVNLFWPGLSLTREIRILRVGFFIFAVFALHANLAYHFFSGPFAQNLEPVGLLIFICCLGFIVAVRIFQNEKSLITLEHELETARQIQSFILPRKMAQIKGLEIAARYVPIATMAGDFYDYLVIDDNRIGILVADVSGHGVPASLIASMVKIAFVSQRSLASDPGRVLAGINQMLCGQLESDFVTAGYLFVDTAKQIASYAGAGHPPLLLRRRREQAIIAVRERGIILGQVAHAGYDNTDLKLQKGDRFILYTDGIVEAFNSAGELYGEERLKAFIEENSSLAPDQFCNRLLDDVSGWSLRRSEHSLDDDITLVVVDFENAEK